MEKNSQLWVSRDKKFQSFKGQPMTGRDAYQGKAQMAEVV
ncbi:MAG: hypothetical protein CM15mV112_030 [uncultured marine virus]|nr:MAG: hypothetical protein CM15mV112_030 [uncultured marine virus]